MSETSLGAQFLRDAAGPGDHEIARAVHGHRRLIAVQRRLIRRVDAVGLRGIDLELVAALLEDRDREPVTSAGAATATPSSVVVAGAHGRAAWPAYSP